MFVSDSDSERGGALGPLPVFAHCPRVQLWCRGKKVSRAPLGFASVASLAPLLPLQGPGGSLEPSAGRTPSWTGLCARFLGPGGREPS